MLMSELILDWLLFALSLAFYALLCAISGAYLNSHPARLQRLEEEKGLDAALAQRVLSQATRLILSLRLGRGLLRLLTLGLGLLAINGPPASPALLERGWLLGWVLALGFFIGIIGYIVEQWVLQGPERTALALAPLAAGVLAVLRPFVWGARQTSRLLLRGRVEKPIRLVTEEEIMVMVDAGQEGGAIEHEEKAMIYSIFQLGDTLAREVMVPRIDILAFDQETPLLEAANDLLETGYSRAPVYNGSIDNIVGLVYLKDLLASWLKDKVNRPIKHHLREAYFVPEAKRLDDLLAEMQAKQIHMAIVVDEYGGTAGLVTIEDIVEEIVGEIRDEYDVKEEASYQSLGEGEYMFSGGIDLDDVNELLGTKLSKEAGETLGGFIYSQLGRVPVQGDQVEAQGVELTVEQVAGRRIRKVRALRVTEASGEGKGNADQPERA
jgi:CBS domain containing-hemolysin-like protein